MKFALAGFGTRGDVEPCVAVGRELLRRGHEVRVAVSPNLVGFAEAAGLKALAYGLDSRVIVEAQHNFFSRFFATPWRVRDLLRLRRELGELVTGGWAQMHATLTVLAEGVDVLFTGLGYQQLAAGVAAYYDIPLAVYHYLPVRPNGQLLPFLPAPVTRSALRIWEWQLWRGAEKLEDTRRRAVGRAKAAGPSLQRPAENRVLEIQAYDEVCFPGLAAEWAQFAGRRPFVGALTLELPTDADEEVASWIAAGTPPIFFGFGSMPVKSPADTLAMIAAACAQLGERALVCSGWTDFGSIARFGHVKVVGAMNYAAAFPACRAVVHHGGAGTTAAGLRAGVPTLILSTVDPGQAIWGAAVKRLHVGITRRLSKTTCESLVADLRTILTPPYVTRAREIAARMTKPADSVAAAAELLENFARIKHVD
ncbi:glycosyltransferase [Mycobacterium sp. SM1]|uniref:glycosyltransferase n=1 Tax=Mycobacterium sp. SM1 TaxID=2816243 RepID=UPI001BCAF5C2|nr:glycosyltransferase [Mycobacterium sp. SM1]MBS4729536.1 glycosyltransferase [Mycobacterium sp. SM1]